MWVPELGRRNGGVRREGREGPPDSSPITFVVDSNHNTTLLTILA